MASRVGKVMSEPDADDGVDRARDEPRCDDDERIEERHGRVDRREESDASKKAGRGAPRRLRAVLFENRE